MTAQFKLNHEINHGQASGVGACMVASPATKSTGGKSMRRNYPYVSFIPHIFKVVLLAGDASSS